MIWAVFLTWLLTISFPVFLFKFRPKSILTELGPLNYKEVVHGTAPHWKAEVKRTGKQDKVRKPCLTSDNDNVTLRDLKTTALWTTWHQYWVI